MDWIHEIYRLVVCSFIVATGFLFCRVTYDLYDRHVPPSLRPWDRNRLFDSIPINDPRIPLHIRRGEPTCVSRIVRRNRTTLRIGLTNNTVQLYGWPSYGGMIVLQEVTALEFTFLGLDPLNVPLCRAATPELEDGFCRRLLRLGAKWYDSDQRFQFVMGVAEGVQPCITSLELEREPALTLRERRWVKVGWPSSGKGVWVAEYDTNWPGILEDVLVPTDAGKVLLARDMDERCEVLKTLGAKFYDTVEDYDGQSFLNAWGGKKTGEVGDLVQTWPTGPEFIGRPWEPKFQDV